MNKEKIGFGLLLVPLVIMTVYGASEAIEKIEINQATARKENLSKSIKDLTTKLEKEKKSEVLAFCEYVKTLKSHEKFVSEEEFGRFKLDCFEGDVSAMPEEYNSKGEKHATIIIPEGRGDRERTKDFVKKNCTQEIFEEFDHIWNYAEKSGVIGSVPFAVVWADSQCGKMLTTPNNPGNVNNNDRGNRVGFFTMQEGLEAVVDTLNNRYISGIQTIGHLSQGGRIKIGSKFSCSDAPMPYKCYATSTENWNNNAMRAIRSIYGDDTTAEFKIRK